MGQYLKGTGWHYGQDTQNWTLTSGEMNHFLKMEIILDSLMKAGVHNWEGFDEAMEAADKELAE